MISLQKRILDRQKATIRLAQGKDIMFPMEYYSSDYIYGEDDIYEEGED